MGRREKATLKEIFPLRAEAGSQAFNLKGLTKVEGVGGRNTAALTVIREEL